MWWMFKNIFFICLSSNEVFCTLNWNYQLFLQSKAFHRRRGWKVVGRKWNQNIGAAQYSCFIEYARESVPRRKAYPSSVHYQSSKFFSPLPSSKINKDLLQNWQVGYKIMGKKNHSRRKLVTFQKNGSTTSLPSAKEKKNGKSRIFFSLLNLHWQVWCKFSCFIFGTTACMFTCSWGFFSVSFCLLYSYFSCNLVISCQPSDLLPT